MSNRHMTYYKMLETFDKPGCPVCRLTDDALDAYFRHLYSECTGDEDFVIGFRDNNGFCAAHAEKFMSGGERFGAGVVYRYLLEKIVKAMKEKPAKVVKTLGERHCPACSYRAEREGLYVSQVLTHAPEDDFRAAFEKSEGLCLPHLVWAYRIAKKLPPWFELFHRERYAAHLQVLEKFLNFHNVSLGDARPVMDASEMDIWETVIRTVTGSR